MRAFSASIQSGWMLAVLWLSAMGLSAARGANMTIQDIVENVRRNEALYDNLDVTMKYHYELSLPNGASPPTLEGGGTVPGETDLVTHYVRQNGMYRLDDEGGSTTAMGYRAEDRVRAFDGEQTRLYEQHAIGNIVTGRLDDGLRIEPHILLLRPILEARVPLSVFLSGDKAVRAHPLNVLGGDIGLTSSYKGTTDFDGLHCHLVWVLTTDASGEPIHRHELLLAEGRNYIPVSKVSYTFRWSTDKPVSQATVTDLREVEPGIWFPYGTRFTRYDSIALRDRGVQKVSWTENYLCEEISLHPNYPRAYFSDVTFPDGTFVYIVENGKQKTSYVKGAPGTQSIEIWRSQLILGGNLLIVMLVLLLVVKRRSRRGGQPKSVSESSVR